MSQLKLFYIAFFLCISASGFAMQLDPQNAQVLQSSIPKELQAWPFIIYPLQTDPYNVERFIFNKRFNIFPKAIIIPKSKKNLAQVLSILREKNLNFSVRSGGHCFEPGSLSPDYVLDLRHFDSIKLKKHGEIYVGAGVRSGSVIEALGELNHAIPTGTCQTVGISGVTLGGGIGFLVRSFGLTCDALKKVTLLTADSDIIDVDQDHFPDLFWALRGAGNNSYGIALGYTFKTFSVPAASFFELEWEWDPVLVVQIFNAWHAWIAVLPDSINPVLSLDYTLDKLSISILGIKVGSDPFVEWIPAFGSLNPKVTINTGSYLGLAPLWEDSPTTPFLKVKSFMAFTPVSAPVIAQTIAYFQMLQATQANFLMNFQFVALGGQYAQGDTAFFPRDAVEWWHLRAAWNQQEQEVAALASIRTFYASVAPLVSNFCYTNDTDYDLGPAYLNAYYGDHVNELMQIKSKYDPQNIFHWEQSIPVN